MNRQQMEVEVNKKMETVDKLKKEDESLEQILSDFFKELPESLQEAIKEINLAEKVPDIVKKHNIQEKERNFLRDRIRMVLMTLITENEFKENLARELLLKEDTLNLLLEDIEKEIFAPVENMVTVKEGTTKEEELDTQSVVDLEEKIELIGKKNNLRVDEIGVLEKEIRRVISGETASSDLASKIRARVNWDEEKMSSIIKDINSEIFEGIRKSLGQGAGEDADIAEEKLDRDEILKEIEEDTSEETGGTPTSQSGAKNFLSGNIEKQPEPEREVSAPEIQTGPRKEFFEDKLSTSVAIDKEEKDFSDKKAPLSKETYKGGIDPYREPTK